MNIDAYTQRARRLAVSCELMRPLMTVPALLLLIAACGRAETSDLQPDTTDPATGAATTGADIDDTMVELDPPPDFGPVEPLLDLDGWLQTDIDSLEDLRGKVVVVQFWTLGCRNCKATIPNLQALYAEHQGEDFEIVGIHSPEFDYEKETSTILAAADELGVTWPIALDTRKRTFFGWQGGPAYWPRTYVLDRQGHVRFDHIGEGAYEELNDTVAYLLG